MTPAALISRHPFPKIIQRVVVAALLSATLASTLRSADPIAPEPDTPAEDLVPSLPKRPKRPRPPGQDWAQWNDVVQFRGSSECVRIVESHHETLDSTSQAYQMDSSTGTFVLKKISGATWGTEEGHVTGFHHSLHTGHRPLGQGRSGTDATIAGESTEFGATLDTKHGKWEFHAYGHVLQPYPFSFWIQEHELVGGQWKDSGDNGSQPKKESAGFSFDGNLPMGAPGPLYGVVSKSRGTMDEPQGKNDLNAHVLLVPEYRDVELVVEIEGMDANGAAVSYAQWIPRGTPSGAAGSRLKIKARLQTPDGGPVNAKVDNFSFTLNDTSREPGVCMNYPLSAAGKKAAPDLKFAPGGETDAERQQLDVAAALDTPTHPHAEARIDCFDFGAWSNLTVTAELADGRIITGHLKGDPGAIMMPLPKRTGGSHIADAWKEAVGATALDDSDDSEKLPSVGKSPGDGFTLYEEYRGFVEAGRHFRTDPQKVDFFVRNYIGGDARSGLRLFGGLTGAVVHSRLTETEFDSNKRIMNANHQDGAHHVDQHGVYLKIEPGLRGAQARFTKAGVRGRPGLCLGVFVQPRSAINPVTTSENVVTSDLPSLYDRMILHELLHVVGSEHHGDSDWADGFKLIFANDPQNKTGKAFFSRGYFGNLKPVAILDETSGSDLAAVMEPAALAERARFRAKYFGQYASTAHDAFSTHPGERSPQTNLTEEETAEALFNDAMVARHFWYVGAPQGECSGDENCAMRYYFAQLYEKKGATRGKAFYYIGRKNTERAGLALCHSAAGTGINASGNLPQSRYGDAKSGCGACADWITFNDAVPPQKAP